MKHYLFGKKTINEYNIPLLIPSSQTDKLIHVAKETIRASLLKDIKWRTSQKKYRERKT